ncbi:hypothetical protein KCU83_g8987, partial [Aureobasidium melanogenum]
MEGVGKPDFVNDTGGSGDDTKPSLTTVRQHAMHDFLRRKREDKPEEDLPPLACPFVKLDPLKHEKCYTFVLRSIPRIKQHLERVHRIPVHCPKCYLIFHNNAEARDRHTREGICHFVPERRLEGIDESTMRRLKRPTTSRSVSESWYSIFALLFPGAKKPESPFMDTTLSAELSAFRHFCTLEGSKIATSIIAANMPSGSGQQQDQLEDSTRQVIEQLFQQWQSRTREPVVETQVMLPPTPVSIISQPPTYAASLSADETDFSEPCLSKSIPINIEAELGFDFNASLRQMAENKSHSSTGTETSSPVQFAQLHRKTSDVFSSEGRSLSTIQKTQLLQPVYEQFHVDATTPSQSGYENVSVPCGGTSGSAFSAANQSQAPELLEHSETIYHKLVEDEREDRGCKQLADRSNSQVSRVPSDTDSVSSSEESMDDLDGLFLDQEVSQLRSWLLRRTKSEHFCQHLQHRLTYERCEGSALQEQSKDSTPRSSSHQKSSDPPSAASSSTAATSCGTSNVGKRRHDNESGEDEQQHKKKRPAQDESECKSAPRLACLFNKHDPVMYRSNAQTNKKFEICGMHDFKDMNKLYEHLKRVHSDQPLQCLRCTCTSFESSEEFQAHQTAPEPCTLIPLNTVKRIQWITHDKRKALQSAISRRLRGCTDEEKWRFAYRWLFPDTNPEDIPCPYLQDPVISIVSSVVDDFEMRLRQLIRASTDLNELEGRISEVRRQFLAQYGIMVNEVEQDPLSLTSIRTVSSSSSSGRLTTTTPLDVADLDQQYLGGYTSHSQTNPSSNHQPSLNVLPPESNALQDVSLEPPATSDPVWLQTETADFDDSILSWDPNHDLWNYDHGRANDNEE